MQAEAEAKRMQAEAEAKRMQTRTWLQLMCCALALRCVLISGLERTDRHSGSARNRRDSRS